MTGGTGQVKTSDGCKHDRKGVKSRLANRPLLMANDDQIELDIDSLCYGRAALGRSQGRVVFVEKASPGDRVRARVTKDHGRYLEATLDEIISPGGHRVEPPCPLIERCGGCPWQHVDYDQQLHAKRQAVVDALERIAGIDDPDVDEIVASPSSFGYRNRLKLRFEHNRLGFYNAGSHRLVPIESCLIAADDVNAGLAEVEAFVASLATRATRVEIASRGELPGLVVAINSQGRLRRGDTLTIAAFVEAKTNAVRGVVAWGKGWQRQWGDTRRRFSLGEDATRVETAGAAFGQVNTEANLALVERVTRREDSPGQERVVDLYAGAGNFALPLARHCRGVTAVESSAGAVEAGKANARSQNISNVHFRLERVEDFLARVPKRYPDRVIINPPRSGVGAAIAALGQWRTPAITYVSCNPSTLARDLLTLTNLGYELARVTPFDLFPQSFHVETVCDLRLT